MMPTRVGAAAGRGVELPPWAVVTPSRRAHIERVAAMLAAWAEAMGIDRNEAAAWRDAARWHDALRDAPEEQLRRLLPNEPFEGPMLHGPAAAARLSADGETRGSVLAAVRYHTVGHAEWDRVGRALYMADFLDPGRRFEAADRAFLAAHVAHDFDGVFRQVVRLRLEWALREGNAVYAETARLWNSVR
jgi:2-amino-4-hydroxy-6-hydroxymethyldihydropteridine diphosphokinase